MIFLPSRSAAARERWALTRNVASIFIFFWLTTNFISCGKRRPPLPPVKTPAISSLSAAQRGSKIILKITPAISLKPLKQISVYRLNEAAGTTLPLTEDEFAARSTAVGTISDGNNLKLKTVYYTDALSSAAAVSRLRYAVRLTFADGRRSGLSNFLIVEPSFQVALPPLLSPLVVKQSAISLEWQKPLANLDQTAPASVLGYNIYRLDESQIADPDEILQPLNAAPVTTTAFSDAGFVFGTRYRYFVRAVSGSGGNPIESGNSNEQPVTPRDVFAPAAPQGLTIAAAPNRLSLFFAVNAEPDVTGYLVFRATSEETPPAGWLQLTATPLAANTFQDTRVETGRKYFYYLKAIDSAGNLSEPSEIVAETAP